MRFYKSILLLSLILAFFIIPTSADVQIANGTIVGDNNQQTTVNDYDYYNYDTSAFQVIDIGLTDSEGNTIVAFNDNSDGKTEIDTAYSDASTTVNYNFLPDPKAVHYTLDTGSISSEVTSIYLGEVIVVTNNRNDSIVQREGEKYQYTIKSSIPVLAYVIHSSDSDKIRSDSGAPIYRWVEQKYTHGNVQVVFDRNHMSTFQQFTFDIEENGKYALVIDTRVSQQLDGLRSKISADTVDIFYSIEKLTMNTTNNNVTSTIIGKVDMFPVDEFGKINTSI
jgi:hypothetical protein